LPWRSSSDYTISSGSDPRTWPPAAVRPGPRPRATIPTLPLEDCGSAAGGGKLCAPDGLANGVLCQGWGSPDAMPVLARLVAEGSSVMSGVGREVELKVELSAQAMHSIVSDHRLAQLAVGAPQTRTLRSVYFDTPDQRLRARGLSLRVRRVGRRWLQTVKADAEVRTGLSNPIEIEGEVHGNEPELGSVRDRAMRKQIKKALDGSALVPMFETVVRRTTQRLRVGVNGEIELALDEGLVRSPAASSEIREAELELKSGPVDALLTVAEALFADEPIRLAEKSKADRGYELVLGRPAAALKPLLATQPDLEPTHSCADALQVILSGVAEQVLHNWQVVAQVDDPEGPHQLRIGLRRLRSALRVFRPVADSDSLRELDAKARELGRVVGALRDADVLIDQVVRSAMASNDGEPGFAKLREVLVSDRNAKRDQVRAALGSPGWSSFQLRLALLSKVADWSDAPNHDLALERPVQQFARKALKRRWRKVARRAERLDKLTIEERHQMRKSLKTLRYAVEFFQPIYPSKAGRCFLRELKGLQEIFGYLNDVAMAKKLMDLSSNRAADGDLQRAVGYVLGWHTARANDAWAVARARWQRLETAPRFWDRR
jgi:triphosphatase